MNKNRNVVFDFFYQDTRRVGSYLAQLDPSGHLLSVKETQNKESGTQHDAGMEVSGSVFVAKGKGQYTDRTISASKSAAERTFDPLWANAITLINYLQENNILENDIEEASIGNFVSCSGQLLIADTSFLLKLYTDPEMQRHSKKTSRNADGELLTESEFNLQLAALLHLPSQIQIHLITEYNKIWGLLQPEYMISSAADIMMKHGASVDGNWKILGIKDANPSTSIQEFISEQSRLKFTYPMHPAVNETLATSQYIRGWVGRPIECFGITPILIYREIGKKTSPS